MGQTFEPELRAVADLVHRHRASAISQGLKMEESSSFQDCYFLYLLIRYFARKAIFEVGTYIGMTAVAMGEAAAKNEGMCWTCDPIALNSFSNHLHLQFIHANSKQAIKQLARSGVTIDFAFFDWIPDASTLRTARKIFALDAILAVHDYGNNEKGAAAVNAIDRYYAREGRWFFPPTEPIEAAPDIFANVCTAYFLPQRILSSEEH